MSPIAILDNYGNIQNELATIIPIPKKITMLSDEIIGKILDYVNQIDIINLSSTNKSFSRICQRKLMENIYVCDTLIIIIIIHVFKSPRIGSTQYI